MSSGGPIVRGVTEAEAMLLTRLDGHLAVRASYQLAAEAGVTARRWRALIDLTADLGVLELPADPASPAATPLLLDGQGALVDQVASVLRDVGLESRVCPGAGLDPERLVGGAGGLARMEGEPALAVVLGPSALDPRSGDPWLRQGIAHLPVVLDGPRAIVGPLVEPSLLGPCLWCLNLHRADRDASWPALLAQLCGSPEAITGPERVVAEGDPVLAHLVGGCIALFARGLHEGTFASAPGVSVEISLPWPRMDHRRWTVHPHCRRPHKTPAHDGPSSTRFPTAGQVGHGPPSAPSRVRGTVD